MCAEPFHVIAQVIRRHRGTYYTVPIATRYDVHDKVWCPPLPYLFQTQTGPGTTGDEQQHHLAPPAQVLH